MKILRTRAELRAETRAWHDAGETIGVVPTMGALHEGHLSLVRACITHCDRTIVTLFVNPRQFNNAEDLAKYPRTEGSDAKILTPLGADVLYVPNPDEIYPEGFATTVSVAGISEDLCGADRPGHFDGVATVVTKLLLQTDADCAFFGEKDFQQLQVVNRLVADLDIGCRIVPCPIVRQEDGLALSSRNLRLGPQARAQAPAMYRAMLEAAGAIRAGEAPGPALERARAAILDAGFTSVDYLEHRTEAGLHPVTEAGGRTRLLAAAWLDGVRLIDNIEV